MMKPSSLRAICLATLTSGILASPLRADPAPTAWAHLASRLSCAPFRSQEELLQLFHILVVGERLESFELSEPELKDLAGTVKTLFPLQHCTNIRYERGILRFTFEGPQRVKVPNSWGQAHVRFPQELTFRVRRESPDSNTLLFETETGYVDLDFALLARWLKEVPGHFRATRLAYILDDAHKQSAIRASNEQIVSRRDVVTTKDGPRTRMDIRTPSFPDPIDIEISPQEVAFLQIRAQLQPDGSMRFNGKRIARSPELEGQFRKMQRMLQEVADGRSDLCLTRELEYAMEARMFRLGASARLHE